MKEERVSGLHLDVDSCLEIDALCGKETEVDLVPVRIAVLGELATMAAWDDRQAAVLPRARPDGSPGCDDPVGRPQCEVAQVLVQRVATVDAGGLVEDVRRQGLEIRSDQVTDAAEEPLVGRERPEDRVVLEAQDLVDRVKRALGCGVALHECDVLHDDHGLGCRLGLRRQGLEARVDLPERARVDERAE